MCVSLVYFLSCLMIIAGIDHGDTIDILILIRLAYFNTHIRSALKAFCNRNDTKIVLTKTKVSNDYNTYASRP